MVNDVVTGTGSIDVSVYDPDFDSRHAKRFSLLNAEIGSGVDLDLCSVWIFARGEASGA